jgi:hypothetical protein
MNKKIKTLTEEINRMQNLFNYKKGTVLSESEGYLKEEEVEATEETVAEQAAPQPTDYAEDITMTDAYKNTQPYTSQVFASSQQYVVTNMHKEGYIAFKSGEGVVGNNGKNPIALVNLGILSYSEAGGKTHWNYKPTEKRLMVLSPGIDTGSDRWGSGRAVASSTKIPGNRTQFTDQMILSAFLGTTKDKLKMFKKTDPNIEKLARAAETFTSVALKHGLLSGDEVKEKQFDYYLG